MNAQLVLEGLDADDPAADGPPSMVFEDWLVMVRPAYEQAAASGREFTAYQVACDWQLPEPPNPCLWGRLMSLLRDEGLIRHAGWTNGTRPTVHGSGVKTWTGAHVPTSSARRTAA